MSPSKKNTFYIVPLNDVQPEPDSTPEQFALCEAIGAIGQYPTPIAYRIGRTEKGAEPTIILINHRWVARALIDAGKDSIAVQLVPAEMAKRIIADL